MKICYIANSAISHTAKWASHFVRLGHEVHVISHENVEIPGVHLHYIDYNIKNYLLKMQKVKKAVDEIKPDILHAHQANTCGLYAVGLKGYLPIVSAWGSDILVAPEKSAVMKWIVKHVLRKAKFITSDAFYMTEKIIELGGEKDKVYTFPMGVEKRIFDYRHEYNRADRMLNVISIRKLERIYNIDIIIKGFSEAIRINPDIRLTIAASGSEERSLKELAVNLGLEDSVCFTGRYNPEEVGKLLSGSDVFISIPDSDSTSVSLLESMAVGVFPVLSDLPGNREWVEDMKNGMIIKEKNADYIQNALLWCAENKSLLDKASHENINIIKKRAVWEDNARIVESLYRKCIKS